MEGWGLLLPQFHKGAPCRKQQEVKHVANNFLVIFLLKHIILGVGEVGFNLVKALSKEKFDITIIDIDEEKCQRITNTMDVRGINGDGANSKYLIELLQWHESQGTEKPTTLKKYVENMKEGQKHIYYITAENEDKALRSPFLEQLNKKGYSCLLLCDAIDEYVTQSLTEYDGKKLINVTKGNLDFDFTEEEKKTQEEQKETFDDLCTKVKDCLGPKVEKVSISQRIVNSPCVISTGEEGWSANMARIMKAQALRDSHVNNFHRSKKIFELNPNSKTIKLLKEKADKLNDTNKKEFTNIVNLLFDTCQIVSGFSVEEPEQYSTKVYNLINLGLGDYDDEEEEEEEENKKDDVDLEKEVEEITLDMDDNMESID